MGLAALKALFQSPRIARLGSRAIHAGTIILGFKSPLIRLAEGSQEVAELVFYSEHLHQLYLRSGSVVSRELALESNRALLKIARQSLSGREKKIAENLLRGRVRSLSRGAEEIDELASSGRLADIGAKRQAELAKRRAKRLPGMDPEDIAPAVEKAIADGLFRAEGDALDQALRLFLDTVSTGDVGAWKKIHEHLSRFTKAPGKARQLADKGGLAGIGEDAFRKMFRGEASRLKGFLLELMFWKSRAWIEIEGQLVREATKRAAKLGPEYEVRVVTEPLRVERTGGEIYDAAILIVKRNTENANVFEGFIHATVQVKAEKRISVVKQVAKDLRRESRDVGQLVLRNTEGTEAFVLRAPVDSLDHTRIIVAPQLPDPASFVRPSATGAPPTSAASRVPPGVDLVYETTLLDAEQLDDVAYFLLKAISDSP